MNTQNKMVAQPTPYERIKTTVDAALPELIKALPKQLSGEKMARVALSSIHGNKRLQQCNPLTILSAMSDAFQCGLEIGGPLGQCWMIPYGQTATLQLGYKGVLTLIWRSGRIKAIHAEVVYEGDDFHHVLGTSPMISHIPSGDADREDKPVTYVYAIVDLTTGGQMSCVMSRRQIDKHSAKYSKAAKKSDSPWNDPLGWLWMSKKTCLLQATKTLELSPDDRGIIARDEAEPFRDRSPGALPTQTARSGVLDLLAADDPEEEAPEDGAVIVPEGSPVDNSEALAGWFDQIDMAMDKGAVAKVIIAAASDLALDAQAANQLADYAAKRTEGIDADAAGSTDS